MIEALTIISLVFILFVQAVIIMNFNSLVRKKDIVAVHAQLTLLNDYLMEQKTDFLNLQRQLNDNPLSDDTLKQTITALVAGQADIIEKLNSLEVIE